MTKLKLELGTIQETLLLTLWARAVDAGKTNPILRDTKSVEIIEQIDYDFSKIEKAKGTQIAICLRGLRLDRWVKSFLQETPNGIIVEIGSGLNTRFERVDNGQVRWFDLDMPDSMVVRKKYFQETERRKFIASSVLDHGWVEQVKAVGSSPIMFLAEGVLPYFSEEQVKQVFSLLVENFPGCYLAFDSMSPFLLNYQNKHDALKHYSAKFQWGIKEIQDIEKWDDRYQIIEVKTIKDAPSQYYQQMDLFNSLLFSIPPFKNMYRFTLVKLG
ncbi:MAG TPA: class I SAM-dependent methyltransferase [Kamptonema sp.]|nr:class I SAM-dependent methyltransferase [Kamptonema sp.]